jgi:hypothetical protein
LCFWCCSCQFWVNQWTLYEYYFLVPSFSQLRLLHLLQNESSAFKYKQACHFCKNAWLSS